MKPCTACRIYNTNAATVCHQCGTPFPQARDLLPIIAKVGTAVLVTVVLVLGLRASRTNLWKTEKTVREPAGLELISSEGFSSVSGKTLVEGRVRNISGMGLKKVYAMVSWFDNEGKKVSSASAPISTNPLLDRQVSPFEVVMSKNPHMENYEIYFFDADGRILLVIDNR